MKEFIYVSYALGKESAKMEFMHNRCLVRYDIVEEGGKAEVTDDQGDAGYKNLLVIFLRQQSPASELLRSLVKYYMVEARKVAHGIRRK